MTDVDVDIEAVVSAWIAATNTHNITKYLACYADGAELDDPSVGDRFTGKERIADYYRNYFIGYNTTTRVVSIEPVGDQIHIVVDFTGDFPGGQTGGIFDVTLAGDKIALVRANLA